MDLKVLMLILVYYIVLASVILMGGASVGDATLTGALNTSSISASELDKGGLFGTGIDFGRFAGLITIGVGLPSDTPSWVSTMFIIWQSVFLIFTIGFVVSAIWNG